MRLHQIALLLIVPACVGGGALPGDDDGSPTPADDDSTEEPTPPVCDEGPALPLSAPEHLSGFTGSEDFAFDDEGRYVSQDVAGNLTGVTHGGEVTLLLPAIGNVAGIDFLPGGDVVWCDLDHGAVSRADLETGARRILCSGISYPNGIDVDEEGFIYVADQGTGEVRRIDSESGDYEVIASGLNAPNGLAFSPDWAHLYVGSFGGGTITVIDRLAGGAWGPPREFGRSGSMPKPTTPCDGLDLGDSCLDPWSWVLGSCVDDHQGGMACLQVLDEVACAGLDPGDSCETTMFSQPVHSVCVEDAWMSTFFCPRTPEPYIRPCFGQPWGAECMVDDLVGWCDVSWEGAQACVTPGAGYDAALAACVDVELGVDCQAPDPIYPTMGQCQDGKAIGYPGPYCGPIWEGGGGGGFDGINVDLCGRVYISEYVTGFVWRWDEEGADPVQVTEFLASWIPNMHWGNGLGGWESDVLYVADRDTAGVFGLHLDVEGRRKPSYPR